MAVDVQRKEEPAEVYDAIVVGAGIAGLGVAAKLQRAGMNTLCLDKNDQAGGRMQSFDLVGGWQLDIGLHMVELGDESSSAALVRAVGKEVKWAGFSQSLEIYQYGCWHSLQDLIAASSKDIEQALMRIAAMDDQDIEAMDLMSWWDWLQENTTTEQARELLSIIGVIMTTISDPKKMSASEILYIARNNLYKKWNFLTAAYPVGGMRGIIKPLQEAFEEAGGTLILNTCVGSVIIQDGVVKGVSIQKKRRSPYRGLNRISDHCVVAAPVVVCAVPLWCIDKILCLKLKTTALPEWWISRFEDFKLETTGLIGYSIALSEEVYDKPNFLCSPKLGNSGLPFQAFVPSAFDPGVAPRGKSLLQTGCVVEIAQIKDELEANRLLEAMWQDLQEMFPDIDGKVEWKFAYKSAACDGLARKPGQVGAYKPDILAPGIEGLYFAGDSYRGRGLALNSAALSASICANKILEKHGQRMLVAK